MANKDKKKKEIKKPKKVNIKANPPKKVTK